MRSICRSQPITVESGKAAERRRSALGAPIGLEVVGFTEIGAMVDPEVSAAVRARLGEFRGRVGGRQTVGYSTAGRGTARLLPAGLTRRLCCATVPGLGWWVGEIVRAERRDAAQFFQESLGAPAAVVFGAGGVGQVAGARDIGVLDAVEPPAELAR